MAEIILSPDDGLESQMREIHGVAGPELSWDLHWQPRPNQPHGGVVVVPDHVAQAWDRHRRGDEPTEAPEEETEQVADEESPEDVDPAEVEEVDPEADEEPGDDAGDEQADEDTPEGVVPAEVVTPTKTTTTRRGKAAQAADGGASA